MGYYLNSVGHLWWKTLILTDTSNTGVCETESDRMCIICPDPVENLASLLKRPDEWFIFYIRFEGINFEKGTAFMRVSLTFEIFNESYWTKLVRFLLNLYLKRYQKAESGPIYTQMNKRGGENFECAVLEFCEREPSLFMWINFESDQFEWNLKCEGQIFRYNKEIFFLFPDLN